jgi:hypothetical protein
MRHNREFEHRDAILNLAAALTGYFSAAWPWSCWAPVLRVALAAVVLGACSDGTSSVTSRPTITVISGGSASDTIGLYRAESLVVELRDQDGHPRAGGEVVFVASPDTLKPFVYIVPPNTNDYGGVVHQVTDQSGRASVDVFPGWVPGTGAITATVVSLEIATSTTFTVLPGKPSRIASHPRDQPVSIGTGYQLVATLVDRVGNALAGAATFSSTSTNIDVTSTGFVTGKTIGRARIDVQIGARVDSAFASVIVPGTMAVFVNGRFIGDTMGFAQVRLDESQFRWLGIVGVASSGYVPENHISRWVGQTGKLVYAWPPLEGSRLFVADSASPPRRLIEVPFALVETDPAVSPDGQWVYFVGVDSAGFNGIWRVTTGGESPRRLTPIEAGVGFRSPTASPDGTRLAYVGTSTPGGAHLLAYAQDLSTGAIQSLGSNDAAGTLWSPTGEWILYTNINGGVGFSGQLHLVHPDGTGDRVLIDGAYFPGGTWSPDGKYIIATPADLGPFSMDFIDVAAGTRVPLAYPAAGWVGPNWRP